MRARHRFLWALVFICAPAAAERPHHGRDRIPGQTFSAAAARIAAPFGIITSTFRTVEHNRAVGGVPDSYHLFGHAIDIVRRRGVSHAQIAAALTAAGFHLIESLDEGDHSHFAFGPLVPKSAHPIPSRLQPAPKSQLAADYHGTLRLDLGSPPGTAGPKPPWSGWGRRAVH